MMDGSIKLCSTVLYHTLPCSTMLYRAPPYSTVLYRAIRPSSLAHLIASHESWLVTLQAFDRFLPLVGTSPEGYKA